MRQGESMGCLTGRICSMRVDKPFSVVDIEVTKDGNFCGWVLLEKDVDLVGNRLKNFTITRWRSVQEEKKKSNTSERCDGSKILMLWVL